MSMSGRIAALRAKARSTQFPHERDAFEAKADALEYGKRVGPLVTSAGARARAYSALAETFATNGYPADAQWCRAYAAQCEKFPKDDGL